MFWDVRYGDEGVPREDGFPALALQGKIELIVPAHVTEYYEDGVVLDTGEKVQAAAVILATGYKSSWDAIFDGKLHHSEARVKWNEVLTSSWKFAPLRGDSERNWLDPTY